jgi:copper(I)-binding protein
MNRPRVLRLLLGLALGSASLAACAGDCVPRVHDGWVRVPPAGLPMAAGFARFDNGCDTAATIVSASSPAFEETTVHATRIENGISRMRAVPELRVAAHSAAEFEPGGLHLMLMRPKHALHAGDKVPVEFRLQDGRVVRAEFTVRKL